MVPEQMMVVYHACCGWDYRRVIPWQLDQLAGAGLNNILCTHVGEGRDWLQAEAWRRGIRLTIEASDPNVQHYETFAMTLIERLAHFNDGCVLYLHTKGVTGRTGMTYQDRWRELMHLHLVERWRDVLPQLDDHDVAGVDWCDWQGGRHFCGNFWMARFSWIRQLPSFASWHNSMGRVRFSCEQWLGNTGSPRVLSLFCRNVWWEDFVKL